MDKMTQNPNHVLLSVHDLEVKFRVRGRILTAIRNISLDIFENESIAIVGEGGSGKSVFTKTFAGMLDSNGFIDRGSIVLDDPELADTKVSLTAGIRSSLEKCRKKLDEYSLLEAGASTWRELRNLEEAREKKAALSDEEIDNYVKSGEPYDKAGGYGIQGLAGKFITSINGDYYNVVGLPLPSVYKKIRDLI